MVRLETLSPEEQRFFNEYSCPRFDDTPWVQAKPLMESRIAIISTAGLHTPDDPPFSGQPGDHYRVIPAGISANDLVMSHVSVNYDRTGFHQDFNVVFPLDRLEEMAADGLIGSVAAYHYSLMGAENPLKWETAARQLAGLLKQDRVDGVLLVPV
jgi:D-proline reductase (dithiol) PrdB